MLPMGATQIAKYNINIHKRGRLPDFRPELKVCNEIHCLQLPHQHHSQVSNGVNEIHSPALHSGLGPLQAFGHTYKYSTSLTQTSQPQAKLPMFQQNGVNESQRTLTLPLDS